MRFGSRLLALNSFIVLLALGCGSGDKPADTDQAPGAATATSAVSAAITPTATQAAVTTTALPSSAAKDANGWYHDWNAGFAAARAQKKPMLVDFYTDWCTWCKKMDAETFADKGIKATLDASWITVKVDAEDDAKKGSYKTRTLTYPEMARAFGVTGFPSYVFIDDSGEFIAAIPGYFPKETFGKILTYFKDELYTKNVDLNSYIKG